MSNVRFHVLLGSCFAIATMVACSGSEAPNPADAGADQAAPVIDSGVDGPSREGPTPCEGKKCGELCSTCRSGEVCIAVVEYCNENGECSHGFPEPSGPQCSSPHRPLSASK